MLEMGMDLWRSSCPNPLLKQGQLEPVAAFENPPKRGNLQPVWTKGRRLDIACQNEFG